MSDNYERLAKLAGQAGYPEDEFTGAEKKLFGSLANGVEVDCDEHAEEEDRTIRAALFEWVFTNSEAAKSLSRHGLKIKHAVFPGGFDLSYAKIAIPMSLTECRFDSGIDLDGAELKRLELDESVLRSGNRSRALTMANGLIDGSLHAWKTKIQGEVYLQDVVIQGVLQFGGATVKNAGGTAFNADRIEVKGDVFLRYGFEADGEARLLRANLGGTLDLTAAKLRNESGCAISADWIAVVGSVFLRDGFEADGEMCLRGANLGGDLSLVGARLRNESGYALNADQIEVKGRVFLRSSVEVDGEVRLHKAIIGGDLVLSDARIRSSTGHVLIADQIEVKGRVYLRNGFKADGEVRFIKAQINGDLVLSDARLCSSTEYALVADNIRVDGRVFLASGFEANGGISAVGGQFGARFRLMGARLRGTLDLAQATFKRSLHLEGGVFERPVETAEGLNESLDTICLDGATIDGGLYLPHEHKQSCIRGRINLRNAKAKALHDSPAIWNGGAIPALGGFTYDAIGFGSPTDARSRNRWLALGREAGGGFAPQPYTQLAKVLQEMGHPREATKILYEREKRQLNEDEYPGFERTLRKWFIGELLGYGYYPWRALVPLLVLFLFGAHLFLIGWKYGHFNPSSPRVYLAQKPEASDGDWRQFAPDPIDRYKGLSVENDDPKKQGELPEHPAFHSVIYSLDTLLPIVDLHVENHWLPTGWYRIYLWFHILAGWVFTTLLVAGLAGVVRRPAE